MYRWMITIAILILLQNYPSLQVAPLLFMSLLSLAYQILVKPFKDPIDRKMNIFYEILASIYLYCFLALAFCPDSQTIGWCLIGIIMLNVIAGMLRIIFESILEIVKRIRKCRLKIAK